MSFSCSICSAASHKICIFCTKDACNNHLCHRCMCCSECCHCDVPINEDATEDEGAKDDAALQEKAVLASVEPETIPSLT